MFGQHVNVRTRAAQLLLVWLLTLASGLLNACALVPDHGRGGRMADAELSMAGETGQQDDRSLPCPDCPQPGDAAGLSACGEFCAEASGAIPIAKLTFDIGRGLALAPLPTLGLVMAAQADPVEEAISSHPLWAPAYPPIPISYLRLTL